MCFKKKICIPNDSSAAEFMKILDAYNVDYERSWSSDEGQVFKIIRQRRK